MLTQTLQSILWIKTVPVVLKKNTIMEAASLLQTDYLDIVFLNRNKTYGGYELRKNYSNRAVKAMGIVILAIAGSAALLMAGKRSSALVQTIERTVDLTALNVPLVQPAIPVRPQPEAPAPPKGVAKSEVPVIVHDEDVAKETEKPAETTAKGDPNGKEEGIKTDIPGTIKGDPNQFPGIKEPLKETKMEAQRYAAVMPAFAGDMAEYLTTRLRYPTLAKENNIQGKVIVEFIVNEDGSVSDAVIKRGIGGGCDEEALRVVRSMPPWKPGLQNDRPVRVFMTLPISFQLQ